jgi:hypothetical protein
MPCFGKMCELGGAQGLSTHCLVVLFAFLAIVHLKKPLKSALGGKGFTILEIGRKFVDEIRCVPKLLLTSFSISKVTHSYTVY